MIITQIVSRMTIFRTRSTIFVTDTPSSGTIAFLQEHAVLGPRQAGRGFQPLPASRRLLGKYVMRLSGVLSCFPSRT